jgi:heat shock protein HslJ
LLGAVERFGALSGRMALTDASGITLLSLIHPAAVPLTERTWRLTAYRNGDEAVVPALPAPVFSLEFDGAGNLSGRACDTYRAVFSREDQQIRLVGPIATSRQGCAGSEQASRQGIDYLAALAKVDRYQIAGNTLLLRDADGRMLASFKEIGDDSAPKSDASNGDNLPAAPVPRLPGLR